MKSKGRLALTLFLCTLMLFYVWGHAYELDLNGGEGMRSLNR